VWMISNISHTKQTFVRSSNKNTVTTS
jgi:hypothetical protein